jgi:hypothetical protein
MKLSKRLKEEKDFVECTLGDSVICKRCEATLKTYSYACAADLCDRCPGFDVIEQCKADFNRKWTNHATH